eukprot:1402746-Amphidinium_carterae.1
MARVGYPNSAVVHAAGVLAKRPAPKQPPAVALVPSIRRTSTDVRSSRPGTGAPDDRPPLDKDQCRWTGRPAAEIDAALIRQGTESVEAGQISDLNFHFRFIQ